MKTKLLILAALTMTLFSLGVFAENKDKIEDTKSGQIAYLTINDKEYKLIIGVKTQLKIGDKQYSVNLRLDPYRIFNNAGIKFKFLSSMHFALDNSAPNIKIWSIDGDNSMIMIQEYAIVVDKKELIDAFKDQYTQMRAKVDIKDIKLKTKNKVLDGKRIDVKLCNVLLSQNVYFIKKGKRTTVIMLQDMLQDNGKNSDEYVKLLKTFTESFEVLK